MYYQYSKFQKGHNSYKHWHKLTTLELDLWYNKTKSYVKFQLDMSMHVEEKCGKLTDGRTAGDRDRRTDGESDGRTDKESDGRRPGRTDITIP